MSQMESTFSSLASFTCIRVLVSLFTFRLTRNLLKINLFLILDNFNAILQNMSIEKETKTNPKKKIKKQVKKDGFSLNLEEMAKAGLHFGHRTSKLHPQMNPYIYGVRKTVHIIDLEKTKEKFEQALVFIKELAELEKILLLVGTKPEHKDLVEELAKECNLPYVTERWLGGSLTNFKIMKQRIKYLKELEEKKQSPDFDRYTKKERADIEKEIQGLRRKFEGLRNLEKLPDAIFACSLRKDHLAIKEANMKGILSIAICDTNTDPALVDYPIPANDDANSSVKYILEKTKETILKSRENAKENKKSNQQPVTSKSPPEAD